MAITIIHYHGGYAVNSSGKVVLGSGYFTGRQKPNFPVPALRTETCFKMYYDKDRKPERLILGTWLIDRTELRYLLFVFKWRVMI